MSAKSRLQKQPQRHQGPRTEARPQTEQRERRQMKERIPAQGTPQAQERERCETNDRPQTEERERPKEATADAEMSQFYEAVADRLFRKLEQWLADAVVERDAADPALLRIRLKHSPDVARQEIRELLELTPENAEDDAPEDGAELLDEMLDKAADCYPLMVTGEHDASDEDDAESDREFNEKRGATVSSILFRTLEDWVVDVMRDGGEGSEPNVSFLRASPEAARQVIQGGLNLPPEEVLAAFEDAHRRWMVSSPIDVGDEIDPEDMETAKNWLKKKLPEGLRGIGAEMLDKAADRCRLFTAVRSIDAIHLVRGATTSNQLFWALEFWLDGKVGDRERWRLKSWFLRPLAGHSADVAREVIQEGLDLPPEKVLAVLEYAHRRWMFRARNHEAGRIALEDVATAKAWLKKKLPDDLRDIGAQMLDKAVSSTR